MKKGIILVLIVVIILSASTAGAYLYSASNVTYSNSNVSSSNVQQAIETMYNKKQICPSNAYCEWKKSWLQVAEGDYVMMTPNPGNLAADDSFSTDTSKTGYPESQKIYPKQLKLWRVIKKNDDGTVEMVSEYLSSTKIYFKGKVGYANFVGYLNEIAAEYANPTYTKTTRCIGYYPGEGGQTEYIKDLTYFDDNGTEAASNWKSSTTSTLKTKAPNEAKGEGDTMYAYDTEMVQNVLGNLQAYKCNDIACSNPISTAYYWLASREYNYIEDTSFEFNGRCMNSRESVSNNRIREYYYDEEWNEVDVSEPFRPIVTLKSGISVNSASGTKDHPFILP